MTDDTVTLRLADEPESVAPTFVLDEIALEPMDFSEDYRRNPLWLHFNSPLTMINEPFSFLKITGA
jgi:hypothetical protein